MAVAQALDVHVTVLQQWLTGDGLIPKRCLLKAIDLFLLGLEMPAVNAVAGEGKAGRK